MSLAIERKTFKIKRENLDRVVFYPEHNVAFNRIAKSGNSSVILYLDEAMRGPSSYQDDYKRAKRSAMSTGKNLIEMSRTKQDRRSLRRFSFFTVVRNPWTRTLSAFLDKITNGPHDKYGSIPGFGDNSRTGFAAFISFLGNGGLHANHHWKPQSDALLLPPSQYFRYVWEANIPCSCPCPCPCPCPCFCDCASVTTLFSHRHARDPAVATLLATFLW